MDLEIHQDKERTMPAEARGAHQTPNPKLFYCNAPNCGKFFNRKEHLTRHFKSHSPNPQHECPICGRRYARSDVLKRHVENHPQNPNPRQPRLPPCQACIKRQSKCDGSIPCQACTRASSECVRSTPGTSSTAVTSARQETQSQRNHSERVVEHNNAQPSLTSMAGVSDARSPSSVFGPNTPTANDSWLAGASTSGSPWTLSYLFDKELQIPRGGEASGMGMGEESNSSAAPKSNSLQTSVFDDASRLRQAVDVPMEDTPPSDPPSVGTDAANFNSSTSLPLSPFGEIPSMSQVTPGQSSACPSSAPEQLIRTYFKDVHPVWPILHKPTFRIDGCSPLLLRSMSLLASLVSGHEHSSTAPMVLSSAFAFQLIGDEKAIPLQTLQAMFLCVVYCISSINSSTMHFRASCLMGYLVASCRQQQILNGQQDQPQQSVQQNALEAWLIQEERNRLAYACLRMDAYLSILHDCPPLIRYYELSIPLPKMTVLWAATTEEERSCLQWSTPSGREKGLFCNIIRDALKKSYGKQRGSLPLTKADYHLEICAFQSGVWEAAAEAHSFASDELSQNPPPDAPVRLWQTHIWHWKQTMETNCQVRERYFSPGAVAGDGNGANADADADDCFAPYSLLLLYVSLLKIHAPIPVLQSMANLRNRLSPAPVSLRNVDLGAKIRSWMSTHCAHMACWYAAQICRVACHEMSTSPRPRRQLLSSLASHSLFMAAVVVTSFAFFIPHCGLCTSGWSEIPIQVDLYTVDEEDEGLEAWAKSAGTHYAVWGSSKLALCGCQFNELVALMREALSVEKSLELAFVSYTEKLQSL